MPFLSNPLCSQSTRFTISTSLSLEMFSDLPFEREPYVYLLLNSKYTVQAYLQLNALPFPPNSWCCESRGISPASHDVAMCLTLCCAVDATLLIVQPNDRLSYRPWPCRPGICRPVVGPVETEDAFSESRAG